MEVEAVEAEAAAVPVLVAARAPVAHQAGKFQVLFVVFSSSHGDSSADRSKWARYERGG